MSQASQESLEEARNLQLDVCTQKGYNCTRNEYEPYLSVSRFVRPEPALDSRAAVWACGPRVLPAGSRAQGGNGAGSDTAGAEATRGCGDCAAGPTGAPSLLSSESGQSDLCRTQ